MVGKRIHDIEVMSVHVLEDFVKTNEVDIAALTLPKDQASRIACRLAELSVEAFWNFAPTDLNLPSNTVVENVHLEESLMRLSYKLSEKQSTREKEEKG